MNNGDSYFWRSTHIRKRIFRLSSSLYPLLPDVLLLASSSSENNTLMHTMAEDTISLPKTTTASSFCLCWSKRPKAWDAAENWRIAIYSGQRRPHLWWRIGGEWWQSWKSLRNLGFWHNNSWSDGSKGAWRGVSSTTSSCSLMNVRSESLNSGRLVTFSIAFISVSSATIFVRLFTWSRSSSTMSGISVWTATSTLFERIFRTG